MSFVQNIEKVVHSMPTPTLFLHGSKKEIDTLLDKVTAFPIVVLMPFTPKNSYTRSGGTNTDFDVTLQFLTKFEAYGDSYRGINADVKPGGFKSSQEVLTAMRGQVISFMIALRNYKYSGNPDDINFKAGYEGAPVFKPVMKRKFPEKELVNVYGENIFGVEVKLEIQTFYTSGFC